MCLWIVCSAALLFGNRVEVGDQVFDGLVQQGTAFEGGVDVVDVSLVMLGVVQLHPLGIDGGGQRVMRVR